MSAEGEVLNIIESKKEELASMLQKLIMFKSVNPPGNEGPIARFLSKRLEESGFEVKLVEVEKDRPNVIGKLYGTEGKKCLLCYSHVDVVPPGDLNNWTYPPFEGVRVNDEIFGRGAQDHKFPIPPFIIAADAIREAGLKLKGNLVFTFVADEETGGEFGFKHLVTNGYFNDTDCMIYGSAASLGDSVIVAANGAMWTNVIVKGKMAHTAFLENGVNAIIASNKVITSLQELAELVNKRSHPITGNSRMSINMIEAGDKINVLPDKCIITIDRRITPSESFEEARKEIQDVLDKIKKKEPDLNVELVTKPGNPPVETDPNSEIVKVVRRSGKEIIGKEISVKGIAGSSDYSWYVNILKKPCVSYTINQVEKRPHAANEFCKISDLVLSAKAYALSIIRYLEIET